MGSSNINAHHYSFLLLSDLCVSVVNNSLSHYGSRRTSTAVAFACAANQPRHCTWSYSKLALPERAISASSTARLRSDWTTNCGALLPPKLKAPLSLENVYACWSGLASLTLVLCLVMR